MIDPRWHPRELGAAGIGLQEDANWCLETFKRSKVRQSKLFGHISTGDSLVPNFIPVDEGLVYKLGSTPLGSNVISIVTYNSCFNVSDLEFDVSNSSNWGWSIRVGEHQILGEGRAQRWWREGCLLLLATCWRTRRNFDQFLINPDGWASEFRAPRRRHGSSATSGKLLSWHLCFDAFTRNKTDLFSSLGAKTFYCFFFWWIWNGRSQKRAS